MKLRATEILRSALLHQSLWSGGRLVRLRAYECKPVACVLYERAANGSSSKLIQAQTTFSSANAIPIPPLTHNVATPRFVFRFNIS